MIKKLMEDTNLVMKQGLKPELVSYTSHSYSFLGFYKNVERVIEGLKIRHPIFVIETGNYDLILGQIFLNFVKFS